MHKVTGETTLGELATLRAMFGVQQLRLDYDPSGERAHATHATLITAQVTCIGTGETEIEALDDAFARLQHRTGSVILATGNGTSLVEP